MTYLVCASGLALILLLVFWLTRISYRSGKKDEQLKQEAALSEIKDAQLKVDTDPDVAERLCDGSF